MWEKFYKVTMNFEQKLWNVERKKKEKSMKNIRRIKIWSSLEEIFEMSGNCSANFE